MPIAKKLRKLYYRYLNRMPHVKKLQQQINDTNKNTCFPAGHYYSPIISVNEIREREAEIWKDENTNGIKGIDLREKEQLAFLETLSGYYNEIPFEAEKKTGYRYYFENDFYSYTDAIALHTIIRHSKPKRVVEVGSGFSSAVLLDTNEHFFGNQIQLTFIEPFTERLESLLTDADKKQVNILQKFVQHVDLSVFKQLEAGDILFIDSTHVVKTGSDVHFIISEILPILQEGVLIHFHDVFYPFEYPREWVFKGKNWNEDYFLKAFLMYNTSFEILFFAQYLHRFHSGAFSTMPLTYRNLGGNLWIRKGSIR